MGRRALISIMEMKLISLYAISPPPYNDPTMSANLTIKKGVPSAVGFPHCAGSGECEELIIPLSSCHVILIAPLITQRQNKTDETKGRKSKKEKTSKPKRKGPTTRSILAHLHSIVCLPALPPLSPRAFRRFRLRLSSPSPPHRRRRPILPRPRSRVGERAGQPCRPNTRRPSRRRRLIMDGDEPPERTLSVRRSRR